MSRDVGRYLNDELWSSLRSLPRASLRSSLFISIERPLEDSLWRELRGSLESVTGVSLWSSLSEEVDHE